MRVAAPPPLSRTIVFFFLRATPRTPNGEAAFDAWSVPGIRRTWTAARAMSDMDASSPFSKPPSVGPCTTAPTLAVEAIPEFTYPGTRRGPRKPRRSSRACTTAFRRRSAAGGTLHVPVPVQVTTVDDQVTHTIQPPPPTLNHGSDKDVGAAKEMVQAQAELLRDFVRKAPPAVFGKGFEEAFDRSVRDGTGRSCPPTPSPPTLTPTSFEVFSDRSRSTSA
jgi:hypothetical protein